MPCHSKEDVWTHLWATLCVCFYIKEQLFPGIFIYTKTLQDMGTLSGLRIHKQWAQLLVLKLYNIYASMKNLILILMSFKNKLCLV